VGPVTKRTKIFLWEIYRWLMMFFRESVYVISGFPIEECLRFPNTFAYRWSKNGTQCLFFQGANWHVWILSSGFQLDKRRINHIQHIFGCRVQKERKAG
jgi:hypothetical protein